MVRANLNPMLLREYFTLLRRFWLLVISLPALVAAISFASEIRQPVRYQTSARMMVAQTVQTDVTDPAGFPDMNLSYSWNSSAYVIDDLPQVVTSRLFAEDVRAYVLSQGVQAEVEAVRGAMSGAVLHRSFTLTVQTGDPKLAEAIAAGATYALKTYGLKYWGRPIDAGPGLDVAVIDPPGAAFALSNTRGLVLNVGLRTGLALAAAFGLALVLVYFDDRIRTVAQAEEWAGARVIGRIPSE